MRLRGVVGGLEVWERVTHHHEARLLPFTTMKGEDEGLLGPPQVASCTTAVITPEGG